MSDLVIRVSTSIIFMFAFVLAAFTTMAALDVKPTSTQGIVILSLLGFLISERLLNIVDILLHERSFKKSTDKYVLLENAVVSSHLEVYTDYNRAYDTMRDLAKTKDVIALKNTVFRYGQTKAENISTVKHDEWMKYKEAIIKKKGREIKEVFDFVDHNYPLLNCTKNKHSRYSGKCISCDVHDCIQMTIFEYADRSKEMFIGGDIGVGNQQWRSCPIFRTRNSEFIQYFENYFNALHQQGTPLSSFATVSGGD